MDKITKALNDRILLLEDAIDHIAKVCAGSRTNTRRLRWISMRANCAISGSESWKTERLPKHEPDLRNLLQEISVIAHAAGLPGMSESDTLAAIRKITLPYWINKDANNG